jgi:bifunctional DNA-binding transcriptional regulator/antitoxin component of YhaV-PrlF toxin-antitoxin module
LFIEFPDELIDELGWQEGDILNWDLKGDGIVLSKVHDASGYQVEEG